MFKLTAITACFLAAIPAFSLAANPSLDGTSGLVHMPDAWVGGHDDWLIGYSYGDPYSAFWSSVTLLPWLELSATYTRIAGVPSGLGGAYGDNKDKSFGAKLRLMAEDGWLPALAIGAKDFHGTRLFRAQYVVASKRLGPLDLSLGYGTDRIDGVFGGARWQVNDNWSVVAEYDATDYRYSQSDRRSKAGSYDKGYAAGLEYRWGWLGAQVSYSEHAKLGVNAFVDIPMDSKRFLPLIHEPQPYMATVERPTEAQWQGDPALRQRLVDALTRQQFRNIAVHYRAGTLKLSLSNSRISEMHRAVGRAARVALALGPVQTQRLEITYGVADVPVATYAFADADKLQGYFSGAVERAALEPTVSVAYADPATLAEVHDDSPMWGAFDEVGQMKLELIEDGDAIRLKGEDASSSRIRIAPVTRFFFNDPSGILKYDVGVSAGYRKQLGEQTYLSTSVVASVLENVSDVTQPSNSTLPHVRSDIADYLDDAPVRLNTLYLNKTWHLAPRWYARASGGLYEQMYGGVGGQVLYYPAEQPWALDLNVDWVRQRDTEGWFGFRDYDTLTGFANLHVRLPYALTATARVGRFLAKDEGVRFELKRRFANGIEIGGWYTVTNGDDITSPGSPSSPYRDKGVFVSIPLTIMLTKDTQASAAVSLAPWTRDVGQMVAWPGDLYDLLEKKAFVDMNSPDLMDNLLR
ncbi:YjbH domain-containing protein [Chitiniphilus purpureus]|uniref:YjbH domain-containing protein n=1 Tax=Chitiniphilus purpureus TaxID=2981137 RepID=A0ABY6DRE9_9NEIS|nr:YjbH domain-containing protein [Chitiniphilus sp. CD1]UXY14488.1 YjbH domain-containing protein [Chitiniphilus sp. CD1]